MSLFYNVVLLEQDMSSGTDIVTSQKRVLANTHCVARSGQVSVLSSSCYSRIRQLRRILSYLF